MRSAVCSFVLLFLVSNQSFAYSFKDFKEELASPVTTPAKWVLIGGTVATLGAFALDQSAQDNASAQQDHLSGLSDLGGAMVFNISYILGMETASLISKDNKYDDFAMIMFKATDFAIGSTFLLKYVAHEPRPDGSDNFSFPSGHSAAVFSFASVIGENHPWYLAVPAYAFASAVGWSRMALNKHRLHDVIAGATIGISYGVGIAHKYAERKAAQSDSKDKTSFDFHVQPSDELDGLVGFANYSF